MGWAEALDAFEALLGSLGRRLASPDEASALVRRLDVALDSLEGAEASPSQCVRLVRCAASVPLACCRRCCRCRPMQPRPSDLLHGLCRRLHLGCCRLLEAFGEQAAALEEPPQPGQGAADDLVQQAAFSGMRLLEAADVDLSVPPGYLRALPALLRRFTRALRLGGEATLLLGLVAEQQDLLQRFVWTLTADPRTPAVVAAPPDLLLAWLAATTAALTKAAPPPRAGELSSPRAPLLLWQYCVAQPCSAPKPDSGPAALCCSAALLPADAALRARHGGALSLFAAILTSVLCLSQAFEPHQAALQQDAQLGRGLVQLLLPAVASTAVGLQLPPERRPHEHCTWAFAASLSNVLASEAMQPALASVLGAPGAADTGARLLHAAAQLVQHAPSSEDGWLGCYVSLLGCAAAAQLERLQHDSRQPANATPAALLRQRRLAQPLLALLPKAAAALLALARHPIMSAQAFGVALALCSVLQLLVEVADPEGSVGSQALVVALSARRDRHALLPSCAAQLTDWYGGVAVALRALPDLAAVAHTAQQPDAWLLSDGNGVALDVSKALGRMCAKLTHAAAQDSSAALASLAKKLDAAQLEAACAAVWQLHSAHCRLCHWAAAGDARSLPSIDELAPSRFIELALFAKTAWELHMHLPTQEAGIR